MEITTKLRQRFCKDCGIPINIFHEPYFSDRLKLFNPFYNTLEKWDRFCEELQKYDDEDEYFAEYNRVKDAAIDFIKSSNGYNRFNKMDMNNFSVDTHGISSKNIYHPSNDKKDFISIDMKKANFSSLKYFSEDIFNNKNSWYDFLSDFTNNEHILNSKYIRQVILGNCNPKRHITYEKYLMGKILDELLSKGIKLETVVFFSNDEIIIDITNYGRNTLTKALDIINNIKTTISLSFDYFKLKKINGIDGYIKASFDQNNPIEFKCINPYMLPFVLRKALNQEVTELDKVFYHEGLLAKFIEVPEIII